MPSCLTSCCPKCRHRSHQKNSQRTGIFQLPIIVLSNTYLTNLMQDAWKAGATKCISKINCSPKDLLDLMRHTIGGGEAISHARRKTEGASATKPAKVASETDAEFQAEFRKTFIASLPATLTVLRAALQSLIKSDTEAARLEHIHELYLPHPRGQQQRQPLRPRPDRAHGRRARSVAQGALRKTEKHQRFNLAHRRRRGGFSRFSV